MRDLMSLIHLAAALPGAVYTADQAGPIIDRLGYDSLTLGLHIGVGGVAFTTANKIEFVLQHGDAPDGSDMAAVGADNVLGAIVTGAGIVKSLTAAHPTPDITKIGYVDGTIGSKRYVRLTADFSGTHATGTQLSASAILGHPQQAPAA